MIYLCNHDQLDEVPMEDGNRIVIMDAPEWKWNLVRLCNSPNKSYEKPFSIHTPSSTLLGLLNFVDLRKV